MSTRMTSDDLREFADRMDKAQGSIVSGDLPWQNEDGWTVHVFNGAHFDPEGALEAAGVPDFDRLVVVVASTEREQRLLEDGEDA